MTDNDDILDDDDEYKIEPGMELLPPEKVIRHGVGLTTALLMSLVAAIAGALGGAVIAEVIRHNTKSDDVGQLQTRLDNLSVDRDALASQISRTQAQVDKLSAKKPEKVGTLEARVKTLEARRTNAPALGDLKARLDAIEKKPAAERSSSYASDDIASRLEILEQRSSPYDMNDILERLDRLEVQSLEAPVSLPAAKAKPLVRTVIIPPLPRANILDAMETQDKKSKSWLDRTLRKHVSIRDADTESPETIMDEIQSYMDEGDYSAALKAFDRLPSGARSAASEWRDAVQAKLETGP